mmetsp:Transcript_37889/g.91884  ORF Transcript_37889/g.91884 Transcript_37889/m.91884 type:complete len:89 (-) Transcript_37889:30-296(-)
MDYTGSEAKSKPRQPLQRGPLIALNIAKDGLMGHAFASKSRMRPETGHSSRRLARESFLLRFGAFKLTQGRDSNVSGRTNFMADFHNI